MTIERYRADFRRMTADEIAAWNKIPAALVGDALNRAQCMTGAIKPLRVDMCVVGQARTAQVPAADNAAIHAILALAEPDQVLVIDGQGHPDTGIWGGILTYAAMRARIAGAVLDGAARDSVELSERGFPVFCRAVVPRGGQKGSYGMVDGPVSVGGVPVRSGDLVIGDGDGVAIVPLQRIEATLAAVKKAKKREAEILSQINAGKTTAELLGITIPEVNQ